MSLPAPLLGPLLGVGEWTGDVFWRDAWSLLCVDLHTPHQDEQRQGCHVGFGHRLSRLGQFILHYPSSPCSSPVAICRHRQMLSRNCTHGLKNHGQESILRFGSVCSLGCAHLKRLDCPQDKCPLMDIAEDTSAMMSFDRRPSSAPAFRPCCLSSSFRTLSQDVTMLLSTASAPSWKTIRCRSTPCWLDGPTPCVAANLHHPPNPRSPLDVRDQFPSTPDAQAASWPSDSAKVRGHAPPLSRQVAHSVAPWSGT